MSGPESLDKLNEEAIARRMSNKAQERFALAEMPDELLNENLSILFEFIKIAVNLVKTELAGQVDEAHAKQLIMNFTKCVTQAIIKCHQHQVLGELKIRSLQALALDVYTMTKELAMFSMKITGAADYETRMEDAKKELKKGTMQRLKFHLDQVKQQMAEG